MKNHTKYTHIPYEPIHYLHHSVDCPMSLEMYTTQQ